MTSKYQEFIFEDYTFDDTKNVLELHYSYDGQLHFTETYRFDFQAVSYEPAALDRAFQALFFIAGVSYYKMYLAPSIVVKKGQLDPQGAQFFSKTYQQGLGEFFFVNQLDPHTSVPFPATVEHLEPLPAPAVQPHGQLVAIGGGKDSLVTVEMLLGKTDISTWSLNHRPQLTPLVERIGLPHYWVERTWDPKIQELNQQDALNGHIPISAIFACVGTIVAVLAGKQDVVVSNEQTANEPTLHYKGVAINHQYSKSQPQERAYQEYLRSTLGGRARYYSFLRPLTEVRIAEIFAHSGFDKYKDVFSSCNRAFVHGSDHLFWDGTCSKCAFVFMALAPFVPRSELEQLFHGKNLLLDPALEPTYRQLLGIEGDKPLECVGDVKESREAMQLAFEQYPELRSKYQFEIPAGYNYRTLAGHEMPPEIFALFTAALAELDLSLSSS